MSKFKIMTALITPFQKNGAIDFDALDRLIDEQILAGIDGFIICGTTAETPCLKEHEKFDLLRWIINRTHHQVELWFGCGTNNTAETLRLVEKASYYDIDGVLLVTPYYNKPSQQGLYKHFKTIADQTDQNIMLYQVPTRCGVTFEESTLLRLFHDCPNITALKYADNDYALIERIHKAAPNIRLLSGEDKTFFQGMNKGLSGLISVMSNAYAKDVVSYSLDPTKQKQAYLEQIAACAFMECSPCAIKYMMYKFGKCEETVRLPLVPISRKTKKVIDAFMENDKIHHHLSK